MKQMDQFWSIVDALICGISFGFWQKDPWAGIWMFTIIGAGLFLIKYYREGDPPDEKT